MVEKTLNGQKAVQDYFSSLLLDTSGSDSDVETYTPALRFALVNPGYELLAVWQTPLNATQLLCRDLMLLTMLSQCSGEKLRFALMNSIQSFNSPTL